ncbi:hypothetical protein V6N12_042648 [Hibiscus sabdariffa]|uniref:Uncharacterized protein n=1 Tax=Hibiscus sabdariffa TaxID=183260 RepID=A0ABR1Z977_9ROSI
MRITGFKQKCSTFVTNLPKFNIGFIVNCAAMESLSFGLAAPGEEVHGVPYNLPLYLGIFFLVAVSDKGSSSLLNVAVSYQRSKWLELEESFSMFLERRVKRVGIICDFGRLK